MAELGLTPKPAKLVRSWKLVVGTLLAAVAVLTVVTSALEDPKALPGSTEQIIFAAATFVSVLVFHWLLWRFIIPSDSIAPAQVTAFLPSRSRRGFFSGTTGFGYVQVAIYCLEFSGCLQHSDSVRSGRMGLLVMGLLLIGLGTVVRLRETFLALANTQVREQGPQKL